ncbi:Gp37 family protein [Acidovorax sp. SUPP3334]|uniref:Gp37 family protein n=1 Tax=Acidovorax sp. SUPP3334 TaxID=2920881 RepID=UPI0023DE5877|nr:Gp37 family protein [Acidovorax sp. SUPP3334]GKT21660.1 Gp37 family protein [Acidovorax sp. SUPP3334]
MSITWELLQATVQRLSVRLPGFAVEYFPEAPGDYRLNHPRGALLVGYGGSRYGAAGNLGDMQAQERLAVVTVTLVFRQLHGRDGAVLALDDVIGALLGFRLPHTTGGLQAKRSRFLGQIAGLWQYDIDFEAPALAVEDVDAEDPSAPLLRHVTRLGPLERTETVKQPSGAITEEDHPL